MAYAAVCVVLAFLWQFLTVRYEYAGNWTGLFYTGDAWPTPPGSAFNNTYVFPETTGYDGQFYRYVAHDPLLQMGYSQFVDNPSVRWRRVLIPGLAHVAALGQASWIDGAFVAVTLGFVFLGVYWLGLYCCHFGLHPSWSLLFGLLPATMISIERLTIDVALAALAVGYALYAALGAPRKINGVLLLAPLARETGILLVAASVLYKALQRRWARAAWAGACALPFLLWALYVEPKAPPSAAAWFSLVPLQGLWSGTRQALSWPVYDLASVFAALVHLLAIVGIWLGLVLSVRHLLWQKRFGRVELGVGLFALLVVFLVNPEGWSDSYAYGRFLSPWLIWLALLAVRSKDWVGLVPLCLVVPRVGAQFATHLRPIWSGLFGN